MKKLVLASAIASTFFGMVSAAQAEVTTSANVGLFSEYRFRGIGQNSSDDPAMQGGFDVDFGNGFYAGNWNSNVEFGDASLEMDFYAGYAGEAGAVSYDVGILKYYYPGSTTDVDALEIYGSLGYMGFTLGANVAVQDDYFGIADQSGANYIYIGYDYAVSDALTLSAHYGTSSFEGAAGSGDYDDYSIGASYAVGGFDLGLAYVDTDLDGAQEVDNINDGTVVFSISKSF